MRDDELDRIIDAGLSTYAEPRSGIEQRVLAAVAAERTAQSVAPHHWRRWAFALPAAACLLAALFIAFHFVGHPGVTEPRQARLQPPPQSRETLRAAATPEIPKQPHVARVSARHARTATPGMPKKQLFPTPQPLNPELQALVEYLANAPKEERKQFVQAQAQLDAPITIAPLHIPPLNESDNENH